MSAVVHNQMNDTAICGTIIRRKKSMTTKKRYFSILLSLVLMLGMLPGLCLTAKAATPTTLTSTSTSWNEDSTISDDTEINSGVTITDDITLTIPKNKTLTVIGGIDADGKTLTVSGKGRLIVSGATITATCSADGCPLPLSTEGGNDHVATLTIGKPTLETYGQTGTDISAEATIIDEKSIMGDAEVLYQTKNNGSYGTATATTSPARRQRRLPPSSSEPADTRTQPTETAT